MRANAMATPLLEEVDAELAQVWRFILEREVEAPERFQVASGLGLGLGWGNGTMPHLLSATF